VKVFWLISLFPITAAMHAAQEHPARLPSIAPSQPFSFAVLGDNRGDDSGQQPPGFLQVLQAVDRENPVMVLDSGDMIYGHTSEEGRVREQWRIYREAISRLRAPMFHVPGNHDLWDEPSARIYREIWGKTYYAFNHGSARFIGLDTETAKGQLGEEQFQWLEQQLESCTESNVFVFLHRPLFPVDGAIGSSLDEYPSERDRIHKLFVRHREIIHGVFAGHEHLYSFQERNGISYYISGGGGAPLYMAPELGGFHHYLLVRVAGSQISVELRKVCASQRVLQKPRRVARGELLESWNQGLFWYAWDRTATLELTPEGASKGRKALRLNFDLSQYAWPVLVLSPASPLDLRDSLSLNLDMYVPGGLNSPLSVTLSLQGATKHEAPPVSLKPGWNTVTTRLDAPWLPSSERRNVRTLEWSVSTGDDNVAQASSPVSFGGVSPPKAEENQAGRPVTSQARTSALRLITAHDYVLFDNFRAEHRNSNQAPTPALSESWERPLLWRVFDETVRAETSPAGNASDGGGLLLQLDFSSCNRPVLFARLNPPWDLRKVKALLVELDVSNSLPEDLTIGLAFRAKDVEFAAPPLPLRAGKIEKKFELDANWLPEKIRTAVELVSFTVASTNKTGAGAIRFRQLSAAKDR
jgi:hypothetical protein